MTQQPETPDWVKHAIFYQIFPDRFAKSAGLEKPNNLEPWDSDPTPRGYKGGDLVGVRERLDFLQELGVTAIYFTPIFQSASNHRYHTHDYYRIDPLLGGDKAFDELLAECHRRGLRVVLDGVFNHASRGFFQFNDILENGEASPWLDWFTFTKHPANAYDHGRPPDYSAWVGLHALPKFNTDNPQVREYLMRVGEYWLRKGIDGWRLDVAPEITSEGFWAEFRERMKAVNPEAYLVGEIWGDASQWLQGDQFDGTMNYLFTEAAIAFCGGRHILLETVVGRSYAPYPSIDGRTYAAKIERLLRLYPWQIQLTQLNLLDSHDTSRLISIVGGDVASVRLATLLLFTFPGTPSIYYGDEIGLTGALPDHWVRKPFPWNHPEQWDRDALRFHQEVIALRTAHPALRVGSSVPLHADQDVYAFARRLDGCELVVAVNVAETPREVDLVPASRLEQSSPAQVLFATGGDVTLTSGPTGLSLTLPARGGAVVDTAPRARPTR
ncbi:MAG: cyclomaltodextrinase / maltogenic alpha-amylase / neopullulanase [Thermomicrobiales bacterium]|nr:cyclomaltodextrinase / maltogenic alpha-amylase / neopullulanase [Thermomicrobiales bacterium]